MLNQQIPVATKNIGIADSLNNAAKLAIQKRSVPNQDDIDALQARAQSHARPAAEPAVQPTQTRDEVAEQAAQTLVQSQMPEKTESNKSSGLANFGKGALGFLGNVAKDLAGDTDADGKFTWNPKIRSSDILGIMAGANATNNPDAKHAFLGSAYGNQAQSARAGEMEDERLKIAKDKSEYEKLLAAKKLDMDAEKLGLLKNKQNAPPSLKPVQIKAIQEANAREAQAQNNIDRINNLIELNNARTDDGRSLANITGWRLPQNDITRNELSEIRNIAAEEYALKNGKPPSETELNNYLNALGIGSKATKKQMDAALRNWQQSFTNMAEISRKAVGDVSSMRVGDDDDAIDLGDF